MTPPASASVSALTTRQQAGLLLHPIAIVDESTDADSSIGFGRPSYRQLINEDGVRFFCIVGPAEPETIGRLNDDLQKIAQEHGSRLPVVFSTDPRHAFVESDGVSLQAHGVSQWPENIGLGAIGDADLVRQYADIVRRDYLAMGIRMALHPQVDLATEPRWGRQAQCFGSDPRETARLMTAYIEGLQGPSAGAERVLATVKHFPGGGPQLDGEDPHFPYGREQVYPGRRFDDHLAPFAAAVDAGAAVIMPYYGMPVGLEIDGVPVEEVGFGFNRQIITGLLRERLGFTGMVLSDFLLVTDGDVGGKPFPAKAWGVEHLSPNDRVGRILNAGVDQLGGEHDVELILTAIESGVVTAEKVAEAAQRVVDLFVKLDLLAVVPARPSTADLLLPERIELGERSQTRALVLLSSVDAPAVLPLDRGAAVHLVGFSDRTLGDEWTLVDANEADVAIVRLVGPTESRSKYFLEEGIIAGDLEFANDVVRSVEALAERVPVVVVVTLTRPAVLTPFAGTAAAIVADFGASDRAVLNGLTGRVPMEGRLPYELPRSTEAVRAGRSDVANDTVDPLFPFGWRVELPGARA